MPYLPNLQQLIWKRTAPFHILHIRAHSNLPGPLSLGTDIVDKCTRMPMAFHSSSLVQAKEFHSLYHVPTKVLQQKFKLSRTDAQQIVPSCPHCVTYHQSPHVGVNPRGLRPLQLWQMDVTHMSDFRYVHVSMDTCSGVIHATPLTGEKAKNVISH